MRLSSGFPKEFVIRSYNANQGSRVQQAVRMFPEFYGFRDAMEPVRCWIWNSRKQQNSVPCSIRHRDVTRYEGVIRDNVIAARNSNDRHNEDSFMNAYPANGDDQQFPCQRNIPRFSGSRSLRERESRCERDRERESGHCSTLFSQSWMAISVSFAWKLHVNLDTSTDLRVEITSCRVFQ